jgi:amidase
MPASFCGIVGLKPTWGLVPYTGIIGLDASIDHAGPMASNVSDCALLLQVIAGSDGLDDRQQHGIDNGQIRYSEELIQFFREPDSGVLLRGVRIGILNEGFGHPHGDPNIDRTVLAAADKFKALGAHVQRCSLPGHSQGQMIWGVATFAGSYRSSALGQSYGRKQVYMTDRIERCNVGKEEFKCAGVGARNMMLSGMYLEKYYGPSVYARCKNLLRKLSVGGEVFIGDQQN